MTTGILLAAGCSSRFGEADKLLAPYRGAPLVLHMARILAQTCPERIATTSSRRVAALLVPLGFKIVTLPRGCLQSESLHAAISALDAPTTILIALADMPNITRADLALFTRAPAAACAQADGPIMPPVLLSPDEFPALSMVSGDQGAGAILRNHPRLTHIRLPEDHLKDIDRPEDL